MEKKLIEAICFSPKTPVGLCLHSVDHINLMNELASEEQQEAFLAHIRSCPNCSQAAMKFVVAEDHLKTPEGRAQMKVFQDRFREVERGEVEGFM